MGFFERFKAKPVEPLLIMAAAKGTFVPMSKIPDEVFAQGILGQCCGIEPAEGKVFAPLAGTITQLPDTLHALGIMGANGVEILLHVGVDTVEMKGQGFSSKVKQGDRIAPGQLLLTMDVDAIRAAGHSPIMITVVTNTDDFAAVASVPAEGDALNPGDALFSITPAKA